MLALYLMWSFSTGVFVSLLSDNENAISFVILIIIVIIVIIAAGESAVGVVAADGDALFRAEKSADNNTDKGAQQNSENKLPLIDGDLCVKGLPGLFDLLGYR